MAIIECPQCNELVNEIDSICPNCGADITKKPLMRKEGAPKAGTRKYFLGLPLGKWVAVIIFAVAAILLVFCVYVCLAINGIIDSDIAAKLPKRAIENVTQEASTEVKREIIWENTFGKLETDTKKGYALFTAANDEFSCLIPENFQMCEEEGSLFVFENSDGAGSYSIPYLMIDRSDEYTDPIELLKDKYATYKEAYGDQGFTVVENLVSYEQSAVEVYEFQFTYKTEQGYEILDTRRAIKCGSRVYQIATKELSDKTLSVSDEEVSTIIESFK